MTATRAAAAAAVVVGGLAAAVLALRSRPGALPTIVVAGIRSDEGCLACHAGTRGLVDAHAPERVGCSTCHLGDPTTRDRSRAHAGMTLLAGDLAIVDRTCGRTGCHATEAARVQSGLMAGAPGILAVDRFAFGERADPGGDADDDLRSLRARAPRGSLAEAHVRKLCGSCHLAAPKERAGDLGIASRGGGCTACHLAPPRAGAGGGRVHPDVSAVVPEARCVGCHARSGRIALSYRGVVELEPGDPRVVGALEDGRPVGAAPPDVHARAGMTCIDCHAERDLMGDGATHRHAEEGVEIACADCHQPSRSAPEADADRARVAGALASAWRARGMPALPDEPPLRTRGGTPLWRTGATSRSLALAVGGERLAIAPASAAPYHAMRGHERLACQACHTVWAPRCTSCHTTYDAAGADVDHFTGTATPGAFVEKAGGNGWGAPLLALDARGRIGPFVEGMTLRIDAPPRSIERVLWAPLDAHTTGPSRACPSCHRADAATDVYPAAGETTRVGARLLDDAERGRVRAVAACLACHPRWDDVVWRDLPASRARVRAARGSAARGASDPVAARCGGATPATAE